MRSGVCEMHLEPVYISGVWWLDLTQAAEMLSLSPASLKRHYIAYDLDSIVWHHVLLFRLDEQTGVEPLCPVDERSHDDGRQTLAIAYDGRRGLGRKVAYQVNALKDILQFVQ